MHPSGIAVEIFARVVPSLLAELALSLGVKAIDQIQVVSFRVGFPAAA